MTSASPPIPPISGSPPQTIPYPTPAAVKDEPLSLLYRDAFALIPDAKVQRYINTMAVTFGSSEVLRHTQRNEAVLYGACHLLALRLIAEKLLPDQGGGGGLAGPVSSVKLEGAAQMSYGVKAWEADDLSDWLKKNTPFLTELKQVIASFPPTMYVVGSDEALADLCELTPYFELGEAGY